MSYRNFLSKSLNRNELLDASKLAKEGFRFCNGLCQDYKPSNDFSNNIPNCRTCRNQIDMAIRKIEEGSISLEQFKENPDIVNNIEKDIVFITNKVCNVCNQEKTINLFEAGKNVCKQCRSKQAIERNNKDIDILIEDVKKAQHNLVVLENFIKGIPKDKLVKVISHFEIGRKSTDKKENMVFNIVQHFRKLLQPKLCQGGCGYTLQEEFTMCLACKNQQEKPRAVSKMIDFNENLDEIVDNLTQITRETFDVYNTIQLTRIYFKMTEKNIKQGTKKEDIVKIINEELKKKTDEKQRLRDEIELQNKLGGEITLNGINILSREDGLINATAMCKAGGKKFGHWMALDSTKQLIKALEEIEKSKTVFPISVNVDTTTDIKNTVNPEIHDTISTKLKVIDIKKGGNDKNAQGSWIHPDLAVQLAQWISPTFSLQVSHWIRELALTGSVIVGNEKTHTELIALQNEIIKQKETITYLQNKHSKFLEKQRYHQFKEGSVFYIISDNDSKTLKFKPGLEGSDINRRLAEHRSTTPAIKLEYLVYTKDNALLEKNILKRYKVKRSFQNHEWIFDITREHLIDSVKMLLSYLNIDHTVEENLDEYNNSIV
jgi:hypothetical protein